MLAVRIVGIALVAWAGIMASSPASADETDDVAVLSAAGAKETSQQRIVLLKDYSAPSSLEPSPGESAAWHNRREALRAQKATALNSISPSTKDPAAIARPYRGKVVPPQVTGGFENFEGVFPGDFWFLGDENGGSAFWGDVSCESSTGSWSAWCGDTGYNSSCVEYANNQDSYMYIETVYCGFTQNGTNLLYFDVLTGVEECCDNFNVKVEGYVNNPGHGVTGTPDAIFEFTVDSDISDWETWFVALDTPFDPCNFLRISFTFHSDSSVTDRGAYVDNVIFNSLLDSAIYPIRLGFPDPRPDLEAFYLYFGDQPTFEANVITDPQIGQEVYTHVIFHVKNQVDLGFQGHFLLDDVLREPTFEGLATPSPDPTWTAWDSTPWIVEEGQHTWCVVLDPNGVIDETSESNNVWCGTINILPSQTASFGGRVTDSSTGDPIPFAQVAWGSRSTQTDILGDYTLQNVSCTQQTLTASKAGFVAYTESYSPPCDTFSTKDVSLSSESGDGDQDGMGDDWELSFGLNPSDPSGASSDRDGDGLSNREEFELGSDPTNANDPSRSVYVAPPPTGNDSSGTGVESAPWATIALAISRVAPFATLTNPVTIHLAAGTYSEKVVLEPHITLSGADPETPEITVIQYYAANDSEHIVMFGAEGAGIRNVKITYPDVYVAPVALLRISDVNMIVSNCVLDGRFNQSSTGILISGTGSSGTIVEDSIFSRMKDALWVVDSAVTVTRNWFDRISGDAIFIALPAGKQDGQTPQLGDVSDKGGTGFNTFGEVDGSLVQNGNPNRETKAEFNAWGQDNESDISEKMSGNVDFVPFLGKSLGPGTVAAAVLDATSEELVGDDARPAVTIPELSVRALRDDESLVFSFPALAPGSWTASAEADGYQSGAKLIAVSSLHTTTAIFFLQKEGIVDPPDPTEPVDINGDGGVDASDIQLVINAVLGLDINGLNADVNTDAQVNASDIQLVINAVLGVG